MKKLLVGFLALAMIFGFGTSAMAAYDVRTAITSESITGTIDMCEKYGAVTWTFSGGTRIYDGDWMFFDLPRGVELCQSFDFIVVGASLAGNIVPNATHAGALITTKVAAEAIPTLLGPWKIIDLGTNGIADGITVTAGKGLYARVYGTAGTRRVNIAFFDSDDVTPQPAGTPAGTRVNGLFNAANANGNTLLQVDTDAQLTLTLFDGEPWNGIATLKNPGALIMAYKDKDGDAFYGDTGGDTLQHANGNIWDNYICGKLTSTYTEGDRVNVSFDSGGISGDDFLTFQGQREIAHIIGAASITLEACAKRDLCGYVSLAGGQGANCNYQYDAPNEAGYCPDATGQIFSSILNPGNLAIIQMNGGFGAATDFWYVELEIVSGDGTYFGAAPGLPRAINAVNGADLCQGTGGALIASDQAVTLKTAGTTWTPKTRSGAAFTAYSLGAGCGAVAVGSQVTVLTSPLFSIGNPSSVNRLVIDIPTLAYAPSLLTNGAVATVRVKLFKAPCGQIFSADRCLANYVSTCAAAQPTSTLLFPYAVELNGSSGWWFGMSFCNPSTVAGTATITVYEDDGDMGSYTTPAVAAGDMVTMAGGDLLTNLTPAAGNTGTLGDARAHIVVKCNFGFAGGFGMMGNGEDSTGYTANGLPGTNVGNWNF